MLTMKNFFLLLLDVNKKFINNMSSSLSSLLSVASPDDKMEDKFSNASYSWRKFAQVDKKIIYIALQGFENYEYERLKNKMYKRCTLYFNIWWINFIYIFNVNWSLNTLMYYICLFSFETICFFSWHMMELNRKWLKTIYPVSLSKSVFKKRRIPTWALPKTSFASDCERIIRTFTQVFKCG